MIWSVYVEWTGTDALNWAMRGKIGTLAIWIIVMYLVVQCWLFVYNLERGSTEGKYFDLQLCWSLPRTSSLYLANVMAYKEKGILVRKFRATAAHFKGWVFQFFNPSPGKPRSNGIASDSKLETRVYTVKWLFSTRLADRPAQSVTTLIAQF